MAEPSEELMQKLLAMSRLTGDDRSMLKLIDREVKRTPRDHMVHVLKGWVLTRLRQYDKAAESFDAAVKLNPKSAWAYYWRGEAMRAKGDNLEALICFVKAVRLKPYRPSFWIDKGLTEDGLNRFYDAGHSFDKALSLGDKSGWGWYGKARLLMYRDKPAESLEACRKAIESAPAEEEFKRLQKFIQEKMGE